MYPINGSWRSLDFHWTISSQSKREVCGQSWLPYSLPSEILDIHHPGNIFLSSFPAIWQTAWRLTRETCRLGTLPGEYHGGGGGGGGNGYNDDNDDQIITRMITISPLSTAELYPPWL